MADAEKAPHFQAFSRVYWARFSDRDAIVEPFAAASGNRLCRRFAEPIRLHDHATSNRYCAREPELTALILPPQRKTYSFELMRGEVERLATIKDDLDDVGGEKG